MSEAGGEYSLEICKKIINYFNMLHLIKKKKINNNKKGNYRPEYRTGQIKKNIVEKSQQQSK